MYAIRSYYAGEGLRDRPPVPPRMQPGQQAQRPRDLALRTREHLGREAAQRVEAPLLVAEGQQRIVAQREEGAAQGP